RHRARDPHGRAAALQRRLPAAVAGPQQGSQPDRPVARRGCGVPRRARARSREPMNLPVPPRWLRRLLIAPLAVLVSFWVLTTLPLLVIAAAAVSPFLPGSWRALRLLAFALMYLAVELLALVAAFALWVASGFGYALRRPLFVQAHYAVLTWFLDVLVKV